MQRISTLTRAQDLFGAGKDGFVNGNPALAIASTDLNADWFNSMQEEVANAVEGSGQTLDVGNRSQLLMALRLGGPQVGIDTGSANACVVNFAPAVTALKDGQPLWFTAAANNSGPTTLNVNGLGAKAVIGLGQYVLQGGEIVAGGKCEVVWNQTSNLFILVSCTGGAQQVGIATQSQHAVPLGQFASANALNGYQRLPSGIILQWGSSVSSGTSAGNAAVTLPVTFPNSCLHAYAIVGGASAGIYTMQLTGKSQSVVTFSALSGSSFDSNISFEYFAIGN